MSKINIDWKWLAGLVVAIFACIGTYWGVVQNNSPRPYPPVTIAFPYPTSAPSRATEVPRSFGPTPSTSFVAAVTTIAPSPTSEILTCSIQVGQLFANAWANAQVRSSLKCPINAQHSIDSAVEAFEQGFMLWRKDTDRLYTFFYDGTWEDFPNTFRDGIDPEYTCGSPSSPPSPRRGFSLVWCNHPEVRRKLGNAVEREQGFCMPGGGPCDTFQDFENGMMYRISRFDKSYVAFTNSSIWQQW